MLILASGRLNADFTGMVIITKIITNPNPNPNPNPSLATCVIQPWLGFGLAGSFHAVVFNAASLVAMYSHIAAMLTDPGAVPRDSAPLPGNP